MGKREHYFAQLKSKIVLSLIIINYLKYITWIIFSH